MKKIMIILLILVLSGCNQTGDKSNTVPDGSKTLEDVIESSVDFTYIDTYFSFEDMLTDKYPKFYYGKVTRIEENNIWVDALYFDVIKSENNEVIGEIWISIAKDQTRLTVGDEAVLFLTYIESNSYYEIRRAHV